MDANSELIDMRVGHDGTTYESAGTAVRMQVKELTDINDEQALDIEDVTKGNDILSIGHTASFLYTTRKFDAIDEHTDNYEDLHDVEYNTSSLFIQHALKEIFDKLSIGQLDKEIATDMTLRIEENRLKADILNLDINNFALMTRQYIEFLSEKITDSVKSTQFDYTRYDLPKLYVSGDTSGMSKDTKKTLNYRYGDMSGTLTMKWQGSSSLGYEKKNYTVTFDQKFEAFPGWGNQKKYCLKANYIDFSHARNVVSAKLWGQIIKGRSSLPDSHLSSLPNGGAIDGFPIMLIVNDVYNGIYTFNIPKDPWLFGMESGTRECILNAETHSNATNFKAAALCDGVTDFTIEYVPDESDTQWAIDSINQLITACINSTGTSFIDTVGQYIDIDTAIDYFIFVVLLTMTDATDKNYNLVTYDGAKWIFAPYDLDTVFGNHWNGKSYYPVTSGPTFSSYEKGHRLMHLIYTYAKDKLKARYKELRNTVLSEKNILDAFSNFIVSIPKAAYDEEVKIWTKIPGSKTNNLMQIVTYYQMRCKICDAEIDAL